MYINCIDLNYNYSTIKYALRRSTGSLSHIMFVHVVDAETVYITETEHSRTACLILPNVPLVGHSSLLPGKNNNTVWLRPEASLVI